MTEVPRIVRERLRSPGAVGEHPDANLLSAFAEHALAEQEREQVLDHLSRCAECRNVVALALPQVEQEQAVAAMPAHAAASRSWWRSPIVHWSALTAAALIVLIAVGERMRLRQGHSASAPAIAEYQPAQKPETQASETVPAAVQQKKLHAVVPTAGTPRRADTLYASRPGGAGVGENAGTVASVGSAPASATAQNAPAVPPPAAALPMKPYPSADASKIESPSFEKERKIDQAQVKELPVPSTASSQALEVGGSIGTTAAAPTQKRQTAGLSPGRGGTFAKRAYLSPRWSISDSGAVLRSFDGGRSWKDVDVAGGVTFRAVGTVGNDVWAGGSGGALFHSADGGEHWARVRVQANGRALSGDIVRIEFTDSQNGVVVTSTGESWTTSDAGSIWQRQ